MYGCLGAALVDLDNPVVLGRGRLRPSQVATRDRRLTQPQARALFEQHPDVAGLRWWSTHEALWANVTLFDRAGSRLRVLDVQPLTVGHAAVEEAAACFGFVRG